ncbi:MAG: phage tail protein [Calditrichia bacterium]
MAKKSFVRSIIIGSLALFIFYSLIIATDFVVNPHRFDPYKQFKFRVKWDGKYISGISRISGLYRETRVIHMREGTGPNLVRKLPGETTYEPIVLERGRTHDTEFEKWANKVWNPSGGSGTEVSLKDFRKDIIIELLNEAGQVVMAFKVYRCWPSRYSALQELDANSTRVAIESLILEHEGWERDYEVTEPVEPSFTVPSR